MKVHVMNQQSSMMAAKRASKNDRMRGASITASHARAGRSRRGGFTLVELLVVITIIGIILAFVMIAAMDAVRRAEERATQTLITKLEAGLSDRLEALLQNRPEPNYTHGYLAAVWSSLAVVPSLNPLGMIPPQFITLPNGQPLLDANGNNVINPALKGTDRAQAIAWYDYIKSEMPDVFYVQTTTPTGDPTTRSTSRPCRSTEQTTAQILQARRRWDECELRPAAGQHIGEQSGKQFVRRQ